MMINSAVTFFLLATLLLIAGCAERGPSSSQIKQSIRASKGVPLALDVCNPMLGKMKLKMENPILGKLELENPLSDAIEIDGVQIVSVGRRQGAGAGRYWPVRAKITGACQTVGSDITFGARNFDGVSVEYDLSRNEYGEWTARSSASGE